MNISQASSGTNSLPFEVSFIISPPDRQPTFVRIAEKQKSQIFKNPLMHYTVSGAYIKQIDWKIYIVLRIQMLFKSFEQPQFVSVKKRCSKNLRNSLGGSFLFRHSLLHHISVDCLVETDMISFNLTFKLHITGGSTN